MILWDRYKINFNSTVVRHKTDNNEQADAVYVYAVETTES